MNKTAIGAIFGALGVLACREIYKKGYKKGVKIGIDACSMIVKNAIDVQEAVNKKEEEES